MADRRQSFSFRFWPTRRTSSLPPNTTDSPPPVGPTPQSRPVSRQTTTSTTTPQAPPPRSRPISRQTTTTTTTSTPPIGDTETLPRPPSPTNSTSVVQSNPDPKSTPTVKTLADGLQSNATATATTNPTSTNATIATQTPPQPQSTINPDPNSKPTVENPTEDPQLTATGTTNPISTNPIIANQTFSQPIATTSPFPISKPTPEPQADQLPSSTNATGPTSMPPPTIKKASDGTPKPTTSPPPSPSLSNTTPLGQKTPPLNEMQAASPPGVTHHISPKGKPKISTSPTPAKPISPSKSGSPARQTNQFKPPLQPSSPSRPTPQAPSITPSPPSSNSKAPSTPQASQPRSLSRSTSNKTPTNSPKRPPDSPSKEPKLIGPSEKGSNLEEPQQEPQSKAEAKSNSANNEIHGVEETTFRTTEPSNTTTITKNELAPTENLKPSIINNEDDPLDEMNSKHEETMDMKESMSEMKEEVNEKTKKKANGIVNPTSCSKGPIIEKYESPSEKKEMLYERKEISPTSFPRVNPTSHTTQPNKRSTILGTGTHDESAQANGEHASLDKDIKGDILAFLNQKAFGDSKNAINNKNVSIITLAGENRGASMQMGPTSLQDGPVQIRRGYKVNPDENVDTANDREESSKRKQLEDAKATEGQPTEAFVNNNTQGINNSVVFNVSIAERNPGVHLAVTHVPKDLIWPPEKISPAETKKAEYNASHAEKITYEPSVRRRCLRGLFMETSGTDLENPEKPRRHGCRVGCQQEKENNTEIS